jgi:bifunctional non-homologous end joining protein LigD
VQLLSRNLKDLTGDYPHIATAAASVSPLHYLLDGEIVALDAAGVPSFQALQHRSVGRAAIVFYAFDLLHFGDTDLRRKPLHERRLALERLTFASPILQSMPPPGSPEHIERGRPRGRP